jgi:predicted dehydrogenase
VTAPRAGIVGIGFMGRVHAQALHAVGVPIARVAASSPSRAQAAATALGAAGWSTTAHELVEDPAVDVVHVCTPNALHADLTRAALAAGKGVICEKPLATTVEDARDLLERAAARRALAVVPFAYRFYPSVREARERVRSGALGRVVLVHGGYLQDWLAGPDRTDWRVDPAIGGRSRAFGDIGVHWCDLAEFMSGQRITRLSARVGRAFDHRPSVGVVETEDFVAVQFETDGGALGSALISQVSAGRKNALHLFVDCEGGAVAFDQESPDLLWTGHTDASETSVAAAANWSAAGRRLAVVPPGHPYGYQDCFTALMKDAYAELTANSNGAPDGLPTFADGLRAAILTDAVLRSAEHGQWVDVEPPGG